MTELSPIRQEGYLAHAVGVVLSECPYDFDSRCGVEWMCGWWDGYYGLDSPKEETEKEEEE